MGEIDAEREKMKFYLFWFQPVINFKCNYLLYFFQVLKDPNDIINQTIYKKADELIYVIRKNPSK